MDIKEIEKLRPELIISEKCPICDEDVLSNSNFTYVYWIMCHRVCYDLEKLQKELSFYEIWKDRYPPITEPRIEFLRKEIKDLIDKE